MVLKVPPTSRKPWIAVLAVIEGSNDLPGVVDAICAQCEICAGNINGAEGAADVEETDGRPLLSLKQVPTICPALLMPVALSVLRRAGNINGAEGAVDVEETVDPRRSRPFRAQLTLPPQPILSNCSVAAS